MSHDTQCIKQAVAALRPLAMGLAGREGGEMENDPRVCGYRWIVLYIPVYTAVSDKCAKYRE